jgi:hypothetical protein
MDSIKHYGCFGKGSNPLRTTNWRIKEGNGVPACLLNKNPLSWAWFESTVLRKKKQGSWGVRSPRFVWDEENSQVRILPTLLKNGSVVQLEEQGSSKALVGGSSPSGTTKITVRTRAVSGTSLIH